MLHESCFLRRSLLHHKVGRHPEVCSASEPLVEISLSLCLPFSAGERARLLKLAAFQFIERDPVAGDVDEEGAAVTELLIHIGKVVDDEVDGGGDRLLDRDGARQVIVGFRPEFLITTDRRTYHLTLTSSAGPAMSAISWTYPQDTMLALKRAADAAAAATPVASALDVDQLHFNYTITGDQVAWKPLRAFDDGKQTYIELPAGLGSTDAPPLFVTGDKGAAELVNFRLRGRYYIVDRLFDVAEMRLGTKRQQVVRIARGASRRGRAS
ncbi:MAG: TrbG/VirB9 family P-type conjugative transfer protein [Sphingomonas sp.]|nr:TrbG/VirB9 family P-type conjugative transfer protein [Sphingomonas sp.]